MKRLLCIIYILLLPILANAQIGNWKGKTVREYSGMVSGVTDINKRSYWESHIYLQIHDVVNRMDKILYASDYTTIENSFTGLSDSSGGILFFPKGDYTLSGTYLSAVDDMALDGEGHGSRILKAGNGTGTDQIIYASGDNYGIIQNLTFESQNTGSGHTGYAINLVDSDHWIIFNCVFKNFATDAIKMSGTSTHLLILGCTFDSCADYLAGVNDYFIFGCDGAPNTFSGYIDGDIDILGDLSVTGRIDVDTVGEYTGSHKVVFPDDIKADEISEVTANNRVVFPDEVKVDTVLERTAGSHVSFPDGVATDTVHSMSDLHLKTTGDIYGVYQVSTLEILNEGDIAAIKDPFWLGADAFPLEQLVYIDETFNNVDSANYITVSSVSGTGDTRDVTLSWVPYRTTLFSPNSGQNWAILISNSWEDAGTEPNRSGDATEILKVNSGTYSTKTLNCTDYNGWSISNGDTVVIYNPFGGSWEWSTEPLIEPSGSGWRQGYVSPGPVFLHSDGYLRMFINGKNNTDGTQTVGFGKVHPDSIFTASAWTMLNDDDCIFDTSNALNRAAGVLATGMIKSPNEDAYIVYTMQSDGSSIWQISYIKCTEDGATLEDLNEDILINQPTGVDSDFGQGSPTVQRYNNKYLMLFANRDSLASRSSDVFNNTLIYEGISELATGPFDCDASPIFTSDYDDKASYRSNHTDVVTLITFKGRFYAMIGGTSCWHESGSKGNRWWGLFSRNERDGNHVWVEDTRSPMWINVMQKYTGWTSNTPIWGTGMGASNTYYRASDHSGGYLSFYSNPNDGYVYAFFASNSASDDYRIWGMRLNANIW